MESETLVQYTHLLKAINRCYECEESVYNEFCNECGITICLDSNCCQTFPHYNNTLYVVCNSCIRSIESKLVLQIDYTKLNSLKQKIKLGKTRSFERLLSHD